jgi:crotonobetainyl-CoA:carnitine CoA-transferase CaiB-like acyl-CoA transferase
MESVLEGIRVLDLTNVYSGPYCTLLLKEFGAEVIKVERPVSGDVIRMDAPLTEGAESGTFIILNRGKKSITLDLKNPRGHQICLDMVKKVDVLVENFSPGTMDKLGLGSKELCALNPRLVMPPSRPTEDRPPPGLSRLRSGGPGHGRPDQCLRSPRGAPVKCAVSIADFGTGLYTAYAIMAALFTASAPAGARWWICPSRTVLDADLD